AASRMGVPMDAFSLLTAEDESEAERLAEHLDQINDERKGVVASLVKEVKRKIKERYGGALPSAIVLGNPQWKPSLLGLAANTCAEEYERPVFLWGRDGDGLYKGSCRTGDEVHLVELMTAAPALTFSQFGGHMGAGGFTVSKEIVFDLEKILNEAYEKLKNKKGTGNNNQETSNNNQTGTGLSLVDGIIRTNDVTWNLYDEVNKFAPFGMDNPKPIFMIQNATVSAVKHFGKEKNHLELLLEKEKGGTVSAIAFFKTSDDFGVKLEVGRTATIVGTLEKSTFKWKPELRMRILDVV
ncbi:MAG: DHHA1 domain-containing protein, partial [Candidatus Pacebacteria bacterium]|nr:DHHA1 domain-containing protein [Candidatus Paceibacterota bacterium]